MSVKNNRYKTSLISSEGSPAKSSSILNTPWDDSIKGSLFPSISIDGARWDKLYPYRLLVVQANQSGEYQVITGKKGSANNAIKQLDEKGRFNIFFQPVNDWEFRLPITPQQLSITNPFAISTSSTLRGIVEEHGGTKFKIINMTGSFGVWPYRKSIASPPPERSSIQTFFSGTIQSFETVGGQLSRLSQLIGSGYPVAPPAPVNEEESIGGYAGTGYAHALLLDQFLEQYAELKKTVGSKDKNGNSIQNVLQYRLALDMPKQNQTFLVSPVQFTYSQDIASPNEYKFNLQLKAYKRISLNGAFSAENSILTPNPLSSNTLQKVLTSITETRRALAGLTNLVKAVRSDFQTPFNALRETALYVKELSGLVATVADLPGNIIGDAKFAIADSLANLDQAGKQILAVKEKLKGDVNKMEDFKREREGQPLPNSSDENPSLIGTSSSKTSPINNLFDSPEQNFELFDSLNSTDVNLPQSIQEAVDSEIDRISLTTVDDIQRNKAVIQELAFQISNAFGAGDATYSRIYGKPAPKQRLQEITTDEFDILKKLYDTIQNLGALTINDDLNQNQNAAFEFVKTEAQNSDLLFLDSSTKIRVPVPFGLDMERIAARYLGNQERWLEIATLNALKSPYIDEEGFTRPLLSNADGRQFNLSSQENLFVGQKIIIFSNTQPRQRRTIINLEQISPTNHLVTVDGLDNLEIFTILDSAKVLAYLPGTVNSQDQIFVPSELPVTDDLITRPIPSTQEDELTGLSRVDLLLMEDNDIAINAFGDFRLSYGLTNLFQALRLKFITDAGDIIRHPDFGSGLTPGMSNAETTASNIYNTISALIAQDSRYSGIENLQVQINGPVISVNLSVFVANGLGVLPINFQLTA